MADWVIRPFREEDRARIRELTIEGFDGVSVEQRIDRLCPDAGPPDWKERKAAEVMEELERHPDGCFVAEAAGEVVGYITTAIRPEWGQGRIPNLAVDARVRGQGLGRELIETALADFRRRGLRVGLIETLANNPVGPHLYPRVGFEEIARKIYFAMPLD